MTAEMGLSDVQPLGADVIITSSDELQPAGTVIGVVDGMVVVQCPPNTRALVEG